MEWITILTGFTEPAPEFDFINIFTLVNSTDTFFTHVKFFTEAMLKFFEKWFKIFSFLFQFLAAKTLRRSQRIQNKLLL
jgi:hypothetical protein